MNYKKNDILVLCNMRNALELEGMLVRIIKGPYYIESCNIRTNKPSPASNKYLVEYSRPSKMGITSAWIDEKNLQRPTEDHIKDLRKALITSYSLKK